MPSDNNRLRRQVVDPSFWNTSKASVRAAVRRNRRRAAKRRLKRAAARALRQ